MIEIGMEKSAHNLNNDSRRKNTSMTTNMKNFKIRNPLTKASEKVLIKIKNEPDSFSVHKKLEINQEVKDFLRRSSKVLHKLSEEFLESLAQAHNNGYESDRSEKSEISSASTKEASIKNFTDVLNLFYMTPHENIPGNYDAYVSNCIKLSTYLPKYHHFKEEINKIKENIKENYGDLSFSSSKQLLVLDLDETLIHSDLDLKYSCHDHYLKVTEEREVAVNIRPHLVMFLNDISEHFELIIYTASNSNYADPIIDFIEKDRKYFKYRFYREHCYVYEGIYIKDLTLFDKPLDKVVLVDNNLLSFPYWLSNSILISSFYNDDNDIDLINLSEFMIENIVGKDDIRPIIDDTFQFKMLEENLKKTNVEIEFTSSKD